ncbi:accessory Sec system protein translocase subunit SecY2 [Staphylococcus canis]|uniref:Accessory Sec system protein translocase subunit SecY2 n=1 Tax=Staphylococcus canis TaxID=2724942 RepID=A0ABS0TA56_9STAP|nr:accessory Sec system protein translocase subunit SecY2 [Staphylococcus canis]
MHRIFKQYEYKVLYKRLIFTFFILFIYIFGSHLALIDNSAIRQQDNAFFKLAVSNVGGDIHTINVFSLGLGPWLTAMIFLSLMAYRDVEKTMLQTRAERHYKEKFLTLALAIIQGLFVINQYVQHDKVNQQQMWFFLLILVAGTMMLVWLADQNVRHGIAGPMPIVMLSIVKSIFQHQLSDIHIQQSILIAIIAFIAVALILLLLLELIEYQMPYRDIMSVSKFRPYTYLAWKLNPAGSISIMISLSVFILLHSLITLIAAQFIDDVKVFNVLTFGHVIGITVYLVIQITLGYALSRLMINTKQKTKDFLKNGNYFVGIYPGPETEQYLNRKARRICWMGSVIVGLIIGVPLYFSLLVPQFSQQIYFVVQMIIMVYIGINIAETIKTYLYFDKYQDVLNKYW